MADKDRYMDGGLNNPATRLAQIEVEYQVANHQVGSEAGKEAMRKLHHTKHFEDILLELPTPQPPLPTRLYSPPDGREGGRKQATPQESEEGLVLELGDEINPPHPPYEANRRHWYQEHTVASYWSNETAGCGDWGHCEQRIDPPNSEAKALTASVTAGGYEIMPQYCHLIGGFGTRVWVQDYDWEWLTVTSRLGAFFSAIQADTRDFTPASGPDPTFALLGAKHHLDITLDNRLSCCRDKIIASRSLTEAGEYSTDFNVHLESEMTAKVRVLGAKVVFVDEYIEIFAASDGFAKIAGNFAWGPLQTWLDSLGLSQADLDPRFKLEDIFRSPGS